MISVILRVLSLTPLLSICIHFRQGPIEVPLFLILHQDMRSRGIECHEMFKSSCWAAVPLFLFPPGALSSIFLLSSFSTLSCYVLAYIRPERGVVHHDLHVLRWLYEEGGGRLEFPVSFMSIATAVFRLTSAISNMTSLKGLLYVLRLSRSSFIIFISCANSFFLLAT